MTIAVLGASGFIGTELCRRLMEHGMDVKRFSRQQRRGFSLYIQGDAGALAHEIDGCDAVVVLTGEPLFPKIWTAGQRRKLNDSRLMPLRDLAAAFPLMHSRPRVVLTASATGYYGDRGREMLLEKASAGQGFLADLCRAWEEDARALEAEGTRVVALRFGFVLDRAGGSLPVLERSARLGLGCVFGDGAQSMSWISLGDAVRSMLFALQREDLSGPVNIVSPGCVTQREFIERVAQRFSRSVRLSIPTALLRLPASGQLRELLLNSARVVPQALLGAGFVFDHPRLGVFLDEYYPMRQ